MPKIDSETDRAIDVMIGHRIRARRLVLRLTQEIVAKQLGITFQQLQKYEKGENRLVVSRLYRLSGVLKIPIAYFFGEFEDAEMAQMSALDTDAALPDDVHSRQGVKLMHAFAKIKNANMRRQVTDLVAQIAEAQTD